ncbi:peptidoglycan D,D-transpeptidase FtsI family protein [Petropleomorpha daqingensis]|uniref:Cell division protein FtsI (Penicillin-binding protein 3) n=1 Tax=Petropleomorpha daqingensis TaxID=2026353 RepID=A0A853CKN5_9ACTN|nr:cell division protein FtsI (penicillin-binding protein 3) [Petropleomorpha daqingensis]
MTNTLGPVRRGPQRPAPRADSPFTPRRPPGSRRSRGGLSLAQRALRNKVGLVVLVLLLTTVLVKLVFVQGVDGATYANAAQQDRLRTYPIAALRGAIVDSSGRTLAYTVDANRVVADPTVVKNAQRTAQKLAALLDVPAAGLADKLSGSGRYVVLARHVSPQTTDAIQALGLAGISFEDDPQRLYPAGAVGGQVVGFIGADGDGLAGVERRFQDRLAGTNGQRRVEVGSGGNPIPAGIDESTPAVDGSSVALTIDEDLQYVVEQRLAQACSDGATTRASAVVLDVHTGEVKAMASCPGYDPGHYNETDPNLLGNPAVSDVFEPGSVMKAVSLSAVLEEGVATPDTVLTVPGHIQAGDVVVQDAHDHAPVQWTVTGIMAHSSNIGTIMLTRQVGDETLEKYLRAFGVGSRTGIELPAESPGILQKSSDWTDSRAANVPIGQGVSVTTLQLASIYQTIANGGVRIPPRIVQSVTAADGRVTREGTPDGTRVISEHTASQMTYMLESVVSRHGTAPTAAIDGFLVAGKTGTAQRANPDTGSYAGGGYVTTFAGFAPADDPQYVIAVNLERPTSSEEGGETAAPVFHDIMSYALTAGGVVPSGASPPEFKLDGP